MASCSADIPALLNLCHYSAAVTLAGSCNTTSKLGGLGSAVGVNVLPAPQDTLHGSPPHVRLNWTVALQLCHLTSVCVRVPPPPPPPPPAVRLSPVLCNSSVLSASLENILGNEDTLLSSGMLDADSVSYCISLCLIIE